MGSSYSAEAAIIIKAVNQANTGIASVRKDLEGLTAPLRQLQGLWSAAVGVGAVAAIAKVSREAYQLGKAGAQVLELEQAFRDVVPASEEMLAALRKASGGTIAETSLMLAANKAAMLGVSTSAQQMADLMEVARFRARAMGLDTTQAFSDIVTGLGRMSPLILDNLGIVFDSNTEFAKYAESLGKAASALTDTEKKQALLNATLETGKKQIADAGGLANNEADNFRIFEAAIADARMALNELIGALGIWNTMAQGARGLAEGARMTTGIQEYAKQIKAMEETGRITQQQADALRATLKEQTNIYGDMATSIEQVDARMSDAYRSAGLFAEAMAIDYEGYAQGVDEYAEYIASIGGSLRTAEERTAAFNRELLATGMLLKTISTGAMPGPSTMSWLERYYDNQDAQRKENLRKEEEAAKEATRYWESAYGDMESMAREAMGGLTFSFDYAGTMDQLGFHQDTWDEEARRAMDVVNRGAESPWYQHMLDQGHLTPERLGQFGGDPRAAAASWIHDFEMGNAPGAINMDAVNQTMRDSLTKQESWEGLWGDLANTWMGQVDKDKTALQDAGKAAGRQVMGGVGAAVKTETTVTQLIAESVAPVVWSIIKDRVNRGGGGVPL